MMSLDRKIVYFGERAHSRMCFIVFRSFSAGDDSVSPIFWGLSRHIFHLELDNFMSHTARETSNKAVN